MVRQSNIWSVTFWNVIAAMRFEFLFIIVGNVRLKLNFLLQMDQILLLVVADLLLKGTEHLHSVIVDVVFLDRR